MVWYRSRAFKVGLETENFRSLLHNVIIVFAVSAKRTILLHPHRRQQHATAKYEYLKKLRVRVQVLILKNVLKYEYRKKVRVRVLLQI